MKKSMKLWMVLAIVVLLAVAVPSLVFLPGCNIRDDDSTTTDINKGTVVGTVTDAGTGNGIENVTVTIVEQSAKAVISDETDTDGNYSLPNVAPGTQTITAKKSGYANYSTTVEVTANTTVTQDFSMNAVIASTVTGNVRSSADDAPLVGVKVWIDDIQDFSNSTGSYTLNGVSAGTVVLRASLSSYSNYQLTLIILEDTTVNQNVDMDEDNAPDPPIEGKSNIYGRVTAENKPVSKATVDLYSLDAKNNRQDPPTPEPPKPDKTTETDSDGLYEFLNVDPGNYRVEVIKSGYDTKTETVTATDGVNTRVDTVSLAGGPSPSPSVSPTGSPTSSPTPGQFTTAVCSRPRINQTGNSTNGRVDDSGVYVVFQTNEKLTPEYGNAFTQVYLYNTVSKTLTLVSQKTVDVQIFPGNGNSTVPSISPDGKYIAYATAATNIVDNDAEGFTDILLYNISNKTTTRISTKSGGTDVGANGNSDVPFLNNSSAADGFFCVFQSAGSDIIPTAVTPAGQVNIFRVKIDKTTDKVSSSLLVSQIPASSGADGVPAPRNCANPVISRDGKYVAYESDADALVAAVPTTVNIWNIYHCDTSKTIPTRTARASVAANVSAPVSAGNASISDDGRYVVFNEGPSTAWGSTNVVDVFRKDMSGEIEQMSKPVSGSGGVIGNSQNPWISGDGKYVAFDSLTTGLVENDTNGVSDIFVRDTSVTPNTIARVSLGEANNQSDGASLSPYITGNYVVFHSTAGNLVADSTFIPGGLNNVYIRKWK